MTNYFSWNYDGWMDGSFMKTDYFPYEHAWRTTQEQEMQVLRDK